MQQRTGLHRVAPIHFLSMVRRETEFIINQMVDVLLDGLKPH